MSQSGVVAWSQTAASNGSADSNVNWQEGMAPSAVNNSARGQMASVAKYRDDTAGSLKTGGTTTAYTLSTNQVFSTLAYLSGQELTVRFDQANGASPTLNVDSLGAKAIQIDASTAVPAGFIAADSIWRLTYDNTIPAFILNGVSQAASYTTITTSGDATVGGDLSVAGDSAVTGNETVGGALTVTGAIAGPTLQVDEGSAPSTPASGKGVFYADTNSQPRFINDGGINRILSAFSGQLFHVRHQVTTGTDSGSISAATWTARPLNTSVTNEISSASLSSNQLSLPAGTYWIEAYGEGGPALRRRKMRLRNITGSATLIVGSSGANSSGSGPHSEPTTLRGRFTISGTTTIELQFYAEIAAASSAFGTPIDSGEDEVFTDVTIWKIA